MDRRKLVNIVLVVVAVVVVAVFAFSVRLEASADSVAVLRTFGMTCGSCASRIEKALRTQHGVASVDVNVDAGSVVVGYDSKKARPEVLAEKVTAAGYGSSILQVLTPEQYKAMTGRSVIARKGAGAGCGGGCCENKQVSK